MKVFTNTTFEGFWPVGTAAVVVAKSAELAAELLNKELVSIGLPGEIEAKDMVVISTKEENVTILLDGEY